MCSGKWYLELLPGQTHTENEPLDSYLEKTLESNNNFPSTTNTKGSKKKIW
jgi:hypothetical protein